ncbi:hypothetical protein [Streptacidiphilus sp. P02-A3a]|uniref:hypothetical protein n=1 Tax=Streptacidiphilus sp. P02-A3a TaxID=2704468 RepID=UPI0015FA20A4|nr:hypothetical protein [Streptacidiphilus sp. P02-A3a]QMU70250.1 hypothetical protein GXP74_20535 [Streptacidiphilus sp. P02-A3a]QMU70294.1 hypothetical protein GXP74_20840 [Streptacidiphilus sp. P02-A3a]
MSSSQPLPQRRTSNHPKIPTDLAVVQVELRVPGFDLSGGFVSAARVAAAAAVRGAAGPEPHRHLLEPEVDFFTSAGRSSAVQDGEPS